MNLLQIDMTKQMITADGFIDNFFWPLMVLVATGIGTLIWNFFIRKRFKIIINQEQSYILTNNNVDYAIININFINETKSSINNLRVSSTPNYNFLKGVSTMGGGGRPIQGKVISAIIDITEDEIDATQQINIGAENNLKGNLIIDIQNRMNRIESIEFSYLTKKVKRKINFDKLQVKQP